MKRGGKMKIRKLFYIAIFFVSIYFVAEAISAESGNICNEGCSLDASCSGYTPYLCKKSWALDTCVAKGYDSGFCGGKTDKSGYCYECSGGCILQNELGEKCGLFTTCNADEYCCKRAEWYASNVCKPKYADMGCCGGPPSGGDKTTFLKATITNNKVNDCTGKIKWEVKARNSADFTDYSADCVEGNPEITISSEKSIEATCTSQKIPSAAAGPHKEKITWCGESAEFEYGEDVTSPVERNKKTMEKYDKNIFLISDENWRDVLSLVSVTTWTSEENSNWCQKGYETPENACVYPTLVYHKEGESFDVDSIIYFIQQYSPNKLVIIGEIPQELANLLIAKPELGAGLSENKIQKINTDNYLSYWNSYKDVVYVEDSYELALMASTYASLINAPLILQKNDLDQDSNFENKKVICVGNVNRNCDENYNLEQLQQKYVDETNTDKIILVNTNDLNIKIEEEFQPEKSSGKINEIYSRTSLAAPILASAKHEVIIPIETNTVEDIDNLLEENANRLNIKKGFLTVFGTPDSIESLVEYKIIINEEEISYKGYADILEYSVLNENEDRLFDLSTGRIFGISISDVSSYINRIIFYNSIENSNSIAILAADYTNSIAFANSYQKIFESLNYDVNTVIDYEKCCPNAIPQDYTDKLFIYYDDHASYNWLGLNSENWPLLRNTFILGSGCSSCIYRDHKNPDLMCVQALRKGAIGYLGIIENGGTTNKQDLISNFFTKKTLGESYLAFFTNLFIKCGILGNSEYWEKSQEGFGLLGDPTFKINPSKVFPLSEITKIEDDIYEINLRVAEIPSKFSHTATINGEKHLINIDTTTHIFSSATQKNDLKLFYNKEYWYMNNEGKLIIENYYYLDLALRIGPVSSDKTYKNIETSGNFNENFYIKREEWMNGQRYLWLYSNIEKKEKLPFEIPETESLFETISFRVRLK